MSNQLPDHSSVDAVLSTLLEHRSIRRFRADPIPEVDLHRAVDAGQRAATSSNIQAYCAIRISDPDRLERLVALTGGQRKVAECPLFLAICGDTRRHRLVASRAGRPHVSNLEAFMLAAIDASLFAQKAVSRPSAEQYMDHGAIGRMGIRAGRRRGAARTRLRGFGSGRRRQGRPGAVPRGGPPLSVGTAVGRATPGPGWIARAHLCQ